VTYKEILLSDKERAVLQCVANGQSHVDIALYLEISSSAVGNRLGKVFEKYGAYNAAHAVAEGFRRGELK